MISGSQDGFRKKGSRQNLRDKVRQREEEKRFQVGASAGTRVRSGEGMGFSEGAGR